MKIAIYQGAGSFLDRDANLSRMARLAEVARLQGAELLILPELYLTGYNLGDDAARLAEARDGPSAAAAAAIARRHGLALLYGYPERADGVLYNAALLIDAAGRPAGNYRKTHLFGPEERRLFRPGDTSVVARIGALRIGLLICYDIEFPELVRRLVLEGAELIAVPTALTPPYWEIPTTIVRARAYENQVFVAYANHTGAERELTYIGASGLVGPDGRDILRAGQAEALLIGDIDPSSYEESRRCNTYLADRRPELYAVVAGRPEADPMPTKKERGRS